MSNDIIAWWSGGVTSAVTCKLCIDLYGLDRVRLVFIDTFNEDDDTYRFMHDCEKWYGKEIETISGIGDKYDSIQDVWYKNKSLNVAKGAICSSTLKKDVRKKWEKENEYSQQAFGFDIDEINRAKSMVRNYKESAKPIFPLLMYGLTKQDCVDMMINEGLVLPRAYQMGFLNNNCLRTMCVQGGIGYWQKVQRDFPDKFNAMAKVEHDLTDLKGEPVTMCKDQKGDTKKLVEETGDKTRAFVFLKPHKDYPYIKDISMMDGREPKPLMDCNGLDCGVRDLDERNSTESEINFDNQLKMF